MKLYELSGQYLELQELAEREELPTDAIFDTLEGIDGEIRVKAENIGKVCANWDSDIEALDRQINALTARKRAINNRKENLKEYLRGNMEATGINKIECPFFIINCVPGRDHAVIDDNDKLPDEYVDVVTTIKPDKAAITKALKAGVDVPGAHIEKTKSSIRIK
jgi:chaperonin cofactor prefoldin